MFEYVLIKINELPNVQQLQSIESLIPILLCIVAIGNSMCQYFKKYPWYIPRTLFMILIIFFPTANSDITVITMIIMCILYKEIDANEIRFGIFLCPYKQKRLVRSLHEPSWLMCNALDNKIELQVNLIDFISYPTFYKGIQVYK